jgi:hypothetical protein
MKKNEQERTDRHLDTPSESNQEKHVNFLQVEEESSHQIAGGNNRASDRQKQWKQGIEEGEQARENSDQGTTGSVMPMDDDDTLGIP